MESWPGPLRRATRYKHVTVVLSCSVACGRGVDNLSGARSVATVATRRFITQYLTLISASITDMFYSPLNKRRIRV